MAASNIFILISMGAYLLLMVYIGVKSSKQTNSVDDFYLGNRKLGPIVTAMSAEASDMSSYLLMGIPGLAYLSGTSHVGWTIIGLVLGTYLNWLIVAKRLRRYSEKISAITVPSFFSKRYKDEKNILMMISALLIVLFFIPYTASGFAACGKLFNSLFNIDYHIAMIVSAVVILMYTSLGGFLAASITDLVQSIIMTLALIIVLLFGVKVAGGMENVFKNVEHLAGYLSLTKSYNPTTMDAKNFDFINIISTLAWGLGYFGMPHILLRFMAIRDEKELTLSRRIASSWALISMVVSVFIGMIGLCISSKKIRPFLVGSKSETIIIEISKLLAKHGPITALIAGVVLSGILASTMSTADSQLLAASSSISSDILVDFFHLKLSDKKLMDISRLTIIAISIIGVLIAWNPNSSVFSIVSFAWAGLGASFGPVVLLSLFWKRSNKYGAIAGLIAGGATVFIWKFLVRNLGGAFDIYELLPAFIVGLIFEIIVSLMTKEPDKEIKKIYESIQ